MDAGWKNNIALINFAMRKCHVASLVKFCRNGLGGDSVTDRWSKAGRTDGKIILLPNTLTMKSYAASLVTFRPVI